MTVMNLINYLLEKFGKVQFRTLLVTIGLLLAYSLAVIIGRLVYAAGVMGIGDVLCMLGLWHAWRAIADLVPSITQLLVSPSTNPSTSINLKTEGLGDK
jgi:Flp pilus assembly protein protease CpaA